MSPSRAPGSRHRRSWTIAHRSSTVRGCSEPRPTASASSRSGARGVDLRLVSRRPDRQPLPSDLGLTLQEPQQRSQPLPAGGHEAPGRGGDGADVGHDLIDARGQLVGATVPDDGRHPMGDRAADHLHRTLVLLVAGPAAPLVLVDQQRDEVAPAAVAERKLVPVAGEDVDHAHLGDVRVGAKPPGHEPDALLEALPPRPRPPEARPMLGQDLLSCCGIRLHARPGHGDQLLDGDFVVASVVEARSSKPSRSRAGTSQFRVKSATVACRAGTRSIVCCVHACQRRDADPDRDALSRVAGGRGPCAARRGRASPGRARLPVARPEARGRGGAGGGRRVSLPSLTSLTVISPRLPTINKP